MTLQRVYALPGRHRCQAACTGMALFVRIPKLAPPRSLLLLLLPGMEASVREPVTALGKDAPRRYTEPPLVGAVQLAGRSGTGVPSCRAPLPLLASCLVEMSALGGGVLRTYSVRKTTPYVGSLRPGLVLRQPDVVPLATPGIISRRRPHLPVRV